MFTDFFDFQRSSGTPFVVFVSLPPAWAMPFTRIPLLRRHLNGQT